MYIESKGVAQAVTAPFSFPMQTNKLFFRILLYFLSLLIPIILIGAMFYFQFINTQESNFSEKIRSNLKSSARTIDIYLRTAQEVSAGFFHDSTVNRMLKPNNQFSLEERTELPVLIKTLANYTSIIIEHIDKSFVLIDNEKVMTSEGINDFQVYFQKIYPYEKYSPDFWVAKLKDDMPFEILSSSGIKGSENRSVVPFVTTGYVNGHSAVMVNNISVKTINQTLRNNSLFPSTRFFIMDHQGNLILDSALSGDDKNRIIEQFHDEHPTGKYDLQAEPYIVNYTKSDNFGWRYYAVTPEKEFRQQALGILQLIVTLCVVLILISFGFSVIFSTNLYTPIRRIRDILLNQEEDLELHQGDHKQRNELDLIDIGVHQLLKHNHAFRSQLKQLSEQYTDNVIIHLCNGSHPFTENKLNALLKENLGFAKTGYLCCCLKFNFKDAFYNEIQDVDRLIVMNKLKNVISGLMNDKVNAYVLEYKPYLYAAVVNLDEHEQDLLQKALSGITETFRYDSQYCSIQIGIGETYRSPVDIARSFNEAVTAIENSDQTDELHIAYSSQCILECTANTADNKSGLLVTDILSYIEENFAKDLYLDKIAEQMGLSSKYISRVFKEKTGMNLSDHINQLRIAKAKEMLKTTDLQVNAISELVGIFSRTTFIRLFKKFEGITPIEFKKLSQK